LEIAEFQKKIKQMYGNRDTERGYTANFLWLVEEIGELSKALRRQDRENIEEELADVIAWAVSVANTLDLDIETILMKKYGDICHYCKQRNCICQKK